MVVSRAGFRRLAVAAKSLNGPIIPHLLQLTWCPQKAAVKYLDSFLHDGLQVLSLLSTEDQIPAESHLRNIGHLIQKCSRLRHLDVPHFTTHLQPIGHDANYLHASPVRYLHIQAQASTYELLNQLDHLETLVLRCETAAVPQGIVFPSLESLSIRMKTLDMAVGFLQDEHFQSKAGLQCLEVVSMEGSWSTFCNNMRKWIAQPGLSQLRLDQHTLRQDPQRIDILHNFDCNSLKAFIFRISDKLHLSDGRLRDFVGRHSQLITLDLRSTSGKGSSIAISDLQDVCISCPALQTLGVIFTQNATLKVDNHWSHGMLHHDHPLRVLRIGDTHFPGLPFTNLEYLCCLFPNVEEIDGRSPLYRNDADLLARKVMLEEYCKGMQLYVSLRKQNKPFDWSRWNRPGQRFGSPISM